jgi:hypothetical protein
MKGAIVLLIVVLTAGFVAGGCGSDEPDPTELWNLIPDNATIVLAADAARILDDPLFDLLGADQRHELDNKLGEFGFTQSDFQNITAFSTQALQGLNLDRPKSIGLLIECTRDLGGRLSQDPFGIDCERRRLPDGRTYLANDRERFYLTVLGKRAFLVSADEFLLQGLSPETDLSVPFGGPKTCAALVGSVHADAECLAGLALRSGGSDRLLAQMTMQGIAEGCRAIGGDRATQQQILALVNDIEFIDLSVSHRGNDYSVRCCLHLSHPESVNRAMPLLQRIQACAKTQARQNDAEGYARLLEQARISAHTGFVSIDLTLPLGGLIFLTKQLDLG